MAALEIGIPEETRTEYKGGKRTREIKSTEALPTFPVYLIHSRESLSKLDEFLSTYGQVGFLRIVYDREGAETNRTIAILPDASYDALVAKGYDRKEKRKGGMDFGVTPFRLNERNYPGPGQNSSIFIPIPEGWKERADAAIAAVSEKMQHLTEWGIVEAGSWTIRAPLRSREMGESRGMCFVTFQSTVSIHRIAMVLVLLTDTYWPPEKEEDEDREIFRCFWARNNTAGAKSKRGSPKGGKNEFKVVRSAKKVATIMPKTRQPQLKPTAK